MSDDLPVLRIIPPIAIGAAELTTSNVVEVPPAAYASGTTYAANATSTRFSGVSSTTANVYRSLQAGNIGHTPESSPLWWKWIGLTYAVFVFGGPLGAGYGATARVIDSSAHLVYESMVNSNMADLTDATSWALVGPTNKWAMFDGSNSTQSSSGDPIVVTAAVPGRMDSVSLFALAASSLRIQSTSGYDRTISLTDPAGIDNWYDWFFQPVETLDQIVVTDLPAWLNQSITVTLSNGSATTAVGNMVCGQLQELGMPLADADAGRIDYSKIDTNEWGDTTLTPRRSVPKLSFRVVIENDQVDRVNRLLDRYRATAIVWSGTEDFAATQMFGIYRSFSTAFSWATQSLCSLELEGLT